MRVNGLNVVKQRPRSNWIRQAVFREGHRINIRVTLFIPLSQPTHTSPFSRPGAVLDRCAETRRNESYASRSFCSHAIGPGERNLIRKKQTCTPSTFHVRGDHVRTALDSAVAAVERNSFTCVQYRFCRSSTVLSYVTTTIRLRPLFQTRHRNYFHSLNRGVLVKPSSPSSRRLNEQPM